jgi:anti-anti-sigma regulatory factor
MAGRDAEHTIFLSFAGEFRLGVNDHAVRLLRDAIEEVPDRLIVDLVDVTAIDSVMISILLAGYLAAFDAGIRFQVINARRAVLRRLVAAGVARMLADSDDVGALIAATHRPVRHLPDTRHLRAAGSRVSGRRRSTPGTRPPAHRLTLPSSPGQAHHAGITLRCRLR